MTKMPFKSLCALVLLLGFGCFISAQSLAGYKSGKSLENFRKTAPKACVEPKDEHNESATPKISIGLKRHDREDMALAKSYISYMRTQGQDSSVIRSLYRASIKTGVDFELLLLKASLESDMGRLTVAARSSARGVFQYIEPTWLILMSRYGAKVGYPAYANAVRISKREGFPYFKGNDKYLRTEILALRHDADISALIKGYQIIEETDVIRGYKRGKKVTATDHYIAHMMGLNLAKDFYSLKNRNSILVVARLNNPQMREAAMLNKIFFYKGRTPLTAPQAYVAFHKRVNYELKKIRNVAKYKEAPNCVYAKLSSN